MAELAAWDRGRLGAANGPDVEAARWLVYARVMAPGVTRDISDELEVLALDGIEGRRRNAAVKKRRSAQRRELLGALGDQRRYRELLRLDEPDDPDEDLDEGDDSVVAW